MGKLSYYLKVGQRVTFTCQKAAAAEGLSDGSGAEARYKQPNSSGGAARRARLLFQGSGLGVSFIINTLHPVNSSFPFPKYNAPASPAEYIHRIGRTARIGCRGSSLLVLAPSEAEYVSLLASHKIK